MALWTRQCVQSASLEMRKFRFRLCQTCCRQERRPDWGMSNLTGRKGVESLLHEDKVHSIFFIEPSATSIRIENLLKNNRNNTAQMKLWVCYYWYPAKFRGELAWPLGFLVEAVKLTQPVYTVKLSPAYLISQSSEAHTRIHSDESDGLSTLAGPTIVRTQNVRTQNQATCDLTLVSLASQSDSLCPSRVQQLQLPAGPSALC